jgi:hypothetical protein
VSPVKVFQNLNKKLQGLQIMNILAWGMFVNLVYMVGVLWEAVHVNALQLRHMETLRKLKWKMITEPELVDLVDGKVSLSDELIRIDTAINFLENNDELVSIFGVVFTNSLVRGSLLSLATTIVSAIVAILYPIFMSLSNYDDLGNAAASNVTKT